MPILTPTVKLAVLYTLFASASMLVNICSQIIFMILYQSDNVVELSILVGTIFGFPLRYILEKRYIFSFKSKNINHDGELFILYSLMSVITTIIFWGTEYAFHKIFESNILRYFGAMLGLSIGFYIKYKLDKKFVFINSFDKNLV